MPCRVRSSNAGPDAARGGRPPGRGSSNEGEGTAESTACRLRRRPASRRRVDASPVRVPNVRRSVRVPTTYGGLLAPEASICRRRRMDIRRIFAGRSAGAGVRAGRPQPAYYDGGLAPVAQWTERGRPKACVGGSSPSGGASTTARPSDRQAQRAGRTGESRGRENRPLPIVVMRTLGSRSGRNPQVARPCQEPWGDKAPGEGAASLGAIVRSQRHDPRMGRIASPRAVVVGTLARRAACSLPGWALGTT